MLAVHAGKGLHQFFAGTDSDLPFAVIPHTYCFYDTRQQIVRCTLDIFGSRNTPVRSRIYAIVEGATSKEVLFSKAILCDRQTCDRADHHLKYRGSYVLCWVGAAVLDVLVCR